MDCAKFLFILPACFLSVFVPQMPFHIKCLPDEKPRAPACDAFHVQPPSGSGSDGRIRRLRREAVSLSEKPRSPMTSWEDCFRLLDGAHSGYECPSSCRN
ncbi:hypothetical protein B0T22DRAFT_449214 [Podospora appendiculata]|uniref:Uncharacterized protein n=1 Tax=Podospora appendiculata TaxID=314037 RepID=A0AAE0XH19_9PEZI|nr:hypothetical protein B0T22DRAFT_449214 [Podospora appendiculata]